MYPATDVSLSRVIPSLPSAGKMFLIAWGRMTVVMAILLDIPRLRHASICPLGTALIPERMTSATYAPELSPNATEAINTGLKLTDAKTT